MTSTSIRSIILDDVESVFEIEKNSFPSPWQEDVFFQLALSGGRFPVGDSSLIIMDVMGDKGAVNGYVVWEEDASNNHGHILNIAVEKNVRLQGRGQKLLNHALSAMKSAGIEVRCSPVA